MRVSNNVLLHVCHPGIIVQILSSRRILFFSVLWRCSRMYWNGVAAVAAAAAAVYRGGRVLPASWRQRFPDARLKVHLRFNVVRILWALPVIFHGRLWRFATQMIEVFFLSAQWWTLIHNPRFVKLHIRHFGIFNDGTCTGGWFCIQSRDFSLVTTVNDFVNECTNFNFLHTFLLHRSSLEVRVQLFHLGLIISTLEIALANIHRDVLVLLDVAHVHQCNKMDFPYLCFCLPSSWPPFISCPSLPFHLESTLLGLKDLLLILLGFPRHASLTDRSPKSSEPYVTLDSQSSLIRITFGVHTSVFPGFHLSISYFPDFLGSLEEFCLTDTLCRETRQHVLAFTFREN